MIISLSDQVQYNEMRSTLLTLQGQINKLRAQSNKALRSKADYQAENVGNFFTSTVPMCLVCSSKRIQRDISYQAPEEEGPNP